MFKLFKEKFRTVAKDNFGNVAMLTGLSVFALVTATGISVDMARAQMLQAKIQTALDAAGLAAGATANSVDVQTQATKYFNANFPSGYLGAAAVNVTATMAAGNTKVTLVAATAQPTTFLQVVGIPSVNVGANTEITRSNQGLELAIVLDNTGSMSNSVTGSGSVSKLNALKCALAGNKGISNSSTYCTNNGLVTTGLLDILYGTSTSISNMFITLVPFSDVVYIPTSQKSIMSGATSGGCASARSKTTNSAVEPAFSVTYTGGSTATVTLKLDESPDPPSSGSFNFSKITSSDCPVSPLIPLIQNKNTHIAGIQAMTANGNTMINIGLAWGWRAFSPDWKTKWVGLPTFTPSGTTTTYTMPLDYGTTLMNKVVVLMTDGTNTSGNNSAYGSGQAPTASGLDNRTIEICTAMKNRGIIIYTIGFGPASGVDSTLLSACATKPAYFFLAPTNADLATAFQTIGDSLANLRVSQ
jgi:Flp pilus assembly protein TadG